MGTRTSPVTKWVLLPLLVVAAGPVAGFPCTGDDARCLYAPTLTFAPGELYFPVNFQFDGNADVSDNLANYRTDVEGRGLRTGNQAPVVYVHVASGDTAAGNRDPRFTTLEYWYYYANDPDHLHDWESVYVVLDNGTPVRAVYYQHLWSQTLPWDEVPRNGTHPLIAVEAGKHASSPGRVPGGVEILWSDFVLLGDGDFPAEPGGTWSCGFGCIVRVDAPWCRERWGSPERCSATPLPPIEWAWIVGGLAAAGLGVRRVVRRLRRRRGR